MSAPEDFARALAAVEAAIDWPALGECYCHEGGQAFFPPEQIAAMREAGLEIAGAPGIEPQLLARWILEDALPVRMQLQLHKFIWEPTTRGV